MLSTIVLAALVPLLTGASAQSCPLSFDGRIPTNFSLTDFDSNVTSPYDPIYVLGQGLKWSEVDLFPNATLNSTFLFDKAGFKAFEVTISDKSIFASNPAAPQTGFRRAEQLPTRFTTNSTDSTTGVKTFHFSLQADPTRPLNFSHEYQLVFQEDALFSTNQFALKTGTLFGTTPANASASMQLFIQGNQNKSPVDTLFTTPFDQSIIHNFAVIEDFTANTTQILYSQNASPLVNVTDALPNDVSGNGQFHFGLLKKPTGENLTDITTQGFQESGIDEGIIFGGIFEEDTAGGCVSLS